MADGDPLRISALLAIPRDELLLRASRSSGPGGQHVNTSSTRVELVWDVASSPSLSDAQREHLLRRLAPRLDSLGKLRLVGQEARSQWRNREAVLERFRDLVARALTVPKPRRKTRPTRASKEARLAAKKRRAAIKRERGRPHQDD